MNDTTYLAGLNWMLLNNIMFFLVRTSKRGGSNSLESTSSPDRSVLCVPHPVLVFGSVGLFECKSVLKSIPHVSCGLNRMQFPSGATVLLL